MEPQIFTSAVFGSLTRALDAAALRQETIASNLANVNTPGYHRKEVAFSLELSGQQGKLALMRTDSRHIGIAGRDGGAPTVVTDDTDTMRLDGNNVDPDAESARLAENEVTYAALTQALSSQYSLLKTAIGATK